MGNIFINYDVGIPQIACTDCGKCGSLMGMSLCKIGNRGCCHYFPEFTLVDIQRMAVLEGGKKVLDLILENPGASVNNYSIYVKGRFDKNAYERYISSGNTINAGNIKDHTIFFRTCPFVIPGAGCKLPVRFRTIVCNFFLCEEILERPGLEERFKPYLDERSRYSRWHYRENVSLQHILTENGLGLVSGFDASLSLLAGTGLSNYEFPALEPVTYDSASPDNLPA